MRLCYTKCCNFNKVKLISLLFIILYGSIAMASHIVGGEIFYDCLGNGQYQVTVKIYRDCNSTGAQFDQNLPITVFNGNNTQIDNFTIPFPGSTTLAVNFNNNPCISVPTNICIEEAIYQKVVTLPASSTGYMLSYQRCCRGPNVTNLSNPGNQGLTLSTVIPIDAIALCNSSPRFNNTPPILLCNNETLQFDHSATDPDGDSLVYGLCAPFQGGTSNQPAPNPAGPPPYNYVNWLGGYAAVSPFGAGGATIDPSTGWLSVTPTAVGLYAAGICVNEFRNGVLVSTTRRDFLFRVLDCVVELSAEITPQQDLLTFVSFCQGSTIQFENESFGGTSYNWDFGVPGISTDVSTQFEPTYTFPSPGTFEVTLIVSLTQGCSDTSKQTFIISDEVKAEFTPPDPQCIVGNSFDFNGGGIIPPGSTFHWSFGGGAIPDTFIGLNPTNIVFSESGPIEVAFKVVYDVCEDTYVDEIFVYAEPTIGFKGDDKLKCAPFEAEFINLSFAHTAIVSIWNFGDGGASSTDTHPSHIYTVPGLYDVKLTIFTTSGCIDTLTLIKPEFVEISPSPTASFDLDPLIQDQYEADFHFVNTSEDAYKQWFYFGDGSYTPFSDFIYTYPEPGVYHPYQVVKNIEGCKDTAMKTLTVVPVIPIIVPNAFTPDGNGYNNTFKPILYKPQNYKMWIYNRWGELMFLSEHPEAAWDGKYGGKPAPQGAYVWRIVYYEYDSGLPKEISGHVTLLR